jgi:hypothetical protein
MKEIEITGELLQRVSLLNDHISKNLVEKYLMQLRKHMEAVKTLPIFSREIQECK